MIANCRGGIGTQLIELMGWYALAIEARDTIDLININCGGWRDDGAGNVLKDYISELFVMPKARVRTTSGTAKLGIFQKPGIFDLILKHRKDIRAQLGPMKFYFPAPLVPVLHVRRGDYQWVPIETYIEYARKNVPVCFIGNIADDTADVARESGYTAAADISNTATIDWLAAFFAPEVIGTASTFIISMLFMDPTKHVKMFRNQEGAVFEDCMRPLLRQFEPQFPNFRWAE